MVRFCLVAFFICLFPVVSLAQDSTSVSPEDTSFASFQFTPPKPSKFGGAVGFTPVLLYPDYAPINAFLTAAGAGEFSSGPLVMTGPQIYGYVLVLPNLRLGGQWGSGSRKTGKLTGGITRDVEMSAHYAGINVDYVIPITSRIDISVGALLGWGGLDLTARRDSSGSKDWNHIWGEYGGTSSTGEYSRKMSGSFFIYYPSVNVEVALLRWLGIRAGVGYQGMAGGSWQLDDKYDIYNVPDGINGKGVTINTGLFIGTFIF